MSKKEITKINTKQISIPAHKKTRDFMRSNSFYNPDKTLKDFAEMMDKNVGNPPTQEICDEYQKVSVILGLDTHVPVAEAFPEEYRTFVVNIARDIEKEYSCKSSIEKILAEAIALSQVRIIVLTKTFNNYLLDGSINKEKTAYYNLIGKELDRAHRQLSNDILTLKQIKAPNIPFKVTAKTAFFAQNQQINNNESNYEINE